MAIFLSLQSAMRVTIAAASGQVRTVHDVSGWQREERGWRVETWRNKRMKEVGPSAGKRRNSEKKKSTNATMIVVTDHISLSVLVLAHLGNSTQTAADSCFALTTYCQMCWFYSHQGSCVHSGT